MWVIWLALSVTGGWYLLLLLTALFDKAKDHPNTAPKAKGVET